MTTLRRYLTNDGARVALLGKPERKYTPAVYVDSPVKLHKIPNSDAQYMRDIAQGARDIKPTARRMLKAGKRLGITKKAKRFLRNVIAEG